VIWKTSFVYKLSTSNDIEKSINAFDQGNEKEARRIATAIRATALDNAVMESFFKINLKLKLGH